MYGDRRFPRILVIGDVMIDRYVSGLVKRLSPEAPVPVLSVVDERDVLGGAANVAANCVSLGASVTLIGFIGDDSDGERLAALVHGQNMRAHLLKAGARTTVKTRALNLDRHLIRIDFEEQVAAGDREQLLPLLLAELPDHDLIVLSDYGKGALNAADTLVAACRQAGKPVCVDPKGSDYRRFRGATMIKPNAAEFLLVTGCSVLDAAFVSKAQTFLEDMQLSCLLVTKGETGASIFVSDGTWKDIEGLAVDAIDVTGAGDSAMAGYAVALALGFSHVEAANYANLAGAKAVAGSGTVCVGGIDFGV